MIIQHNSYKNNNTLLIILGVFVFFYATIFFSVADVGQALNGLLPDLSGTVITW